ncbi:hypothetical protein G6F31_015666 [Rhizopus arrhizus]|nr:hypothetical protein G6F31_015666 [Rhizopus arrhizus]
MGGATHRIDPTNLPWLTAAGVVAGAGLDARRAVRPEAVDRPAAGRVRDPGMLGNASARRAAARLGHGLAALLPEALRPGVPSGGADLCRRAPDELRLQQDAVLADAAAGAAAVADRPGAGLDARAARHRRGHPAACDFQRRPHFDDLGRDALGALRRQIPMALQCGIVGLPNVGKSTLFNALTRAGIAAENYPFCTIEPNVGVVEVPDPRLQKLAEIVKPERILSATVEFVDIAGLIPT